MATATVLRKSENPEAGCRGRGGCRVVLGKLLPTNYAGGIRVRIILDRVGAPNILASSSTEREMQYVARMGGARK